MCKPIPVSVGAGSEGSPAVADVPVPQQTRVAWVLGAALLYQSSGKAVFLHEERKMQWTQTAILKSNIPGRQVCNSEVRRKEPSRKLAGRSAGSGGAL